MKIFFRQNPDPAFIQVCGFVFFWSDPDPRIIFKNCVAQFSIKPYVQTKIINNYEDFYSAESGSGIIFSLQLSAGCPLSKVSDPDIFLSDPDPRFLFV